MSNRGEEQNKQSFISEELNSGFFACESLEKAREDKNLVCDVAHPQMLDSQVDAQNTASDYLHK